MHSGIVRKIMSTYATQTVQNEELRSRFTKKISVLMPARSPDHDKDVSCSLQVQIPI